MQKWDELPGFRTYRDFFAEVSPAMRPMAVDEPAKGRLIAAIPEIEFIGERTTGKPGIHERHLTDILDDWRVSARVVEVRRGSEGEYYVRYEVASLYPDGEWATPIFLMAILDGDFHPLRYTFIHETGHLRHGVVARDDKYRMYYDWEDIQGRFDSLDVYEHLLVWNADKYSENFFISCYEGADGGEKEYGVSWSSHDFPWFFTIKGFLDQDAAGRLLHAFGQRGLLGIQDMASWVVGVSDSIVMHPVYYDMDAAVGACAARAKRRAGK